MANQLTKDQIAKFKKAFDAIDVNGDGTISRTEIAAILRAGGEHVNEVELNETIKKYDADGNGEIDFAEFLALVIDTMNEED